MALTVFSATHIGGTALVAGVIALPLAYWALRPRSWFTAGAVSAVAAIATFAWRLPANVSPLNTDGVPGFSANDLLAAVITYVILGIYASLRQPAEPDQFAKLRALLTGMALAVNVVTI